MYCTLCFNGYACPPDPCVMYYTCSRPGVGCTAEASFVVVVIVLCTHIAYLVENNGHAAAWAVTEAIS